MTNYDPTYIDRYGAGPHVAADAIVFTLDGMVLLIKRKDNGKWALPGGFMEAGETPNQTALRELYEETGLRSVKVTYIDSVLAADPKRDPRAHIMSFMCLYVSPYFSCDLPLVASDDASMAVWVPASSIPSLDMYLDHREYTMKMLVNNYPAIDAAFSESKKAARGIKHAKQKTSQPTAPAQAVAVKKDWKIDAIKFLAATVLLTWLARVLEGIPM